jgi:hypothetical protein
VPTAKTATPAEEPKAEEPAKAEETKYVPGSLAAKLALITGEMAHVLKKGHNKAQNYDFVRESDVAEKASALLAAHHVYLHQTVVAREMIDLYKTSSGLQMRLSSVVMEFQFIDGDTGEMSPLASFPGEGADTGDKGIYKAMTGAEKYFLMKTFLVSTGDDPEADEKVDKATAATEATAGPRVVRGNVEGAQRGGKSDKVTSAQVKEMSRLTKEAGLTVVTLIPVVNKLLGTKWALDSTAAQLRALLADLSSENGGKVISLLASGFAADIETEGAPVAADDTAELDEEAQASTVEELDERGGFSLV